MDRPAPVPRWIPAFPLESLAPGSARVLRSDGKQIAVFRPEPDVVRAVDNRCPHEGYPLAQGRLLGGRVLMCAWHNFTFHLDTGHCLAGDERVRPYPTRVVEGSVEVDVADPDPAAAVPGLLESLDEGLLERRLGQVARDVVRLLEAGVAPEELLLRAASFDSGRGEFGMGHAAAVATDVLPMLERYEGVRAALPILQVMDVASQPNVRRPPRPSFEALDPGPDSCAAGETLRAHAEAMNLPKAEGLLRGALAAGEDREVVERWLFALCCDHLIGFGHGLIYQIKVFDLLDRLGWERADEILPGHLAQVVLFPREECIPTHAALARFLDAVDTELPRWTVESVRRDFAPDERQDFVTEVMEGGKQRPLEAVARALEAGVAPSALARALVQAAAERLLRFDVAVDADPALQEGWLDVTHVFTYASAVRQALERFPDPRALRLLFFAAWFVRRGAALDRSPALPRADREAATASLDEVDAAVAARRGDEAARLAASHLEGGGDPARLRARLEDRILADHGTRPIVVAHQIKLLAAGFDEAPAQGLAAERWLPVCAAVRFLASPVRERPVGGLVEEAIRFVSEGKSPRRLTP
ncbi:MAG: Rieske 2Fe-2S domain-containing protein [Myxococcota bacterium]